MYLPLQSILRLKFCENHKEQQIPVKGCSRGLNTSTNAKICSYTNTNDSHTQMQTPFTYKYKYLSNGVASLSRRLQSREPATCFPSNLGRGKKDCNIAIV